MIDTIASLNLTPEIAGIITPIGGIELDRGKTSGGLILTGATTPAIAYAAGAYTMTWVASNSAALVYNFTLPLDAERASRYLKFTMSGKMGGATDTPKIVGTLYARTPGGALKGPFTLAAFAGNATLATPVDDDTAALSNAEASLTLNFANVRNAAGEYIEPGDSVTLELVPGAHTTDTVILHSLRGEYRSLICPAVFANR